MIDIVSLIERGGVYFNVHGSAPEEVIRGLFKTVRLPAGLESAALTTAILEREALMPTAIGYGIAIPHPRSPQVARDEDERIIVAYTREGIPFQALDKQPVYALFVILSANQRNHLQILSQLSFLFHNKDFRKILETRPAREELCAAIRGVSREWD
jgi:PTS system nitrogen regulatory IIA component